MGTTGLTAQALGVGDVTEVRAILARAWLLGLGLGALLVILHPLIGHAAFALLAASGTVAAEARAYFGYRIFGAPASLAIFAVFGNFVGRGRTGDLLKTQLLLNGLNIVFDVIFARRSNGVLVASA